MVPMFGSEAASLTNMNLAEGRRQPGDMVMRSACSVVGRGMVAGPRDTSRPMDSVLAHCPSRGWESTYSYCLSDKNYLK
jgi:hypothetical protein